MNTTTEVPMITGWKNSVSTPCLDAWDFDARATAEVLAKIEVLVTARVLTVPAVALMLYRAGVTASAAEQIAPSIRVAITA